MIAFVVVAAFVACADPPHDPAGDPPSAFESTPPPVEVAPVSTRPKAIVVELVPLGVPDETARLATTLAVGRLRSTMVSHDVRGPASLGDAATRTAAACSTRDCFAAVAVAAHVDVIVHGTVQKLGAGLLVTLDAGAAHGVSQVDDPAGLNTAVEAAADAMLAARAAPTPTTPAPTSTPKTKSPSRGHRSGPANDDLVMLGIDYALLFVPIVGSPFLLPLSQGIVHGFGGKQIVQNDYPLWWQGTVAGYGVYLVGGVIFVGMYGFAVANANNGSLGTLVGLGALSVLAVTVLAEPAVVWWVARQGAVSVGDGVPNASDRDLLRGSPLAASPIGAPLGLPIGPVPVDVAARFSE